MPLARTGGNLLDIGCASVYYSVAFGKAGGHATGIDISEASIALARRRAERESVDGSCQFLQGDMRSLSVREGEYDAVVMVEVLEHVREQREALEQAVRALRPGGVLVLTTPHAFDELPRRQRFQHRNAPTPEAAGVGMQRLGTNQVVIESGIEHDPYFHDAFTFEQIRRLLPPESEIVRLHSLYTPLPGLRLLAHLPPAVRQMIRRMFGGKAPPVSTEELQTGSNRSPEEPLAIPTLNAESSLMVRLSKLMWRVPIVRQTCHHHLLVARRREPSTTEW